MGKTWITLSIAGALSLAGTAGASTIYTLVNGQYSAVSHSHSAAPTELGAWEITEGPDDYAPTAYEQTTTPGVETADFAVMEPATAPYEGLFLHPQD